MRRGRKMMALVATAVATMSVAAAGLPAGSQEEPGRQESASEIAAAAATHDITESEVREQLAEDDTLEINQGRFLYVDEGTGTTPLPGPPTAQPGPFPNGDTFLLHSLPGAQRVIYLDFNGHTVDETGWWNYQGSPNMQWTADPFSLDGTIDTSFSQAEIDSIQSIWQRVAEDYAPFQVDVTTENPGQANITRTDGADQNYGSRVVISRTTNIANMCSCGGVAYVDVFDLTPGSEHHKYQDAWVFPQNLSLDTKNIAEAASHEAGHNLGLSHDGRTSPVEEYYNGHNGWGPIMGSGYDEPVTQWSQGEYDNATTTQDDIAIIASNGPALKADDHSNSTAGATVVPSGATFTSSGVISTSPDVDYFQFSAGMGPATFTANPATVSPNLDIRLQLFDSGGGQIANSNPAFSRTGRDSSTGLNAQIDFNLPADGTYYLAVRGVANGADGNTGWTSYGSLGNYTVGGTVFLAGSATVSFDAASSSVNETAGTATLGLTRVGNLAPSIIVDVSSANGSATAGSDYTAPAATTTIAAASPTGSITVPIIDDTAIENPETFTVTLTSVTPSSGTATLEPPTVHTVTINSNDNGGVLSLSSPTYNVGEDTGPATITVNRTGTDLGPVTVDYATSPGSAAANVDYTTTSGTLSFPAGDTSESFTVPILDDNLFDPAETFTVTLSNPQPAGLVQSPTLGAQSAATVTIVDNEVAGVRFSSATYTVKERTNVPRGRAIITVERIGDLSITSTVTVSTSNGTALATKDYQALTEVVTFNPGESSKTVEIRVFADPLAEPTETVNLALSNLSSGTGFSDPFTAVLSILDI